MEPFINFNPNVWEFDIDDTIWMWDLSAYPDGERVTFDYVNGPVTGVVNQKNIHLMQQLFKSGWYIRAHSGSGVEWVRAVCKALRIDEYVHEMAWKPRGRTDDRAPGDGLAYQVYRKPA